MQYRGGLALDFETFSIPIKSDGAFVFENVPPGSFAISRELKIGSFWSEENWLEVESGKTTFIELGAKRGCAIAGKLAPEEGLSGRIISAFYTSFYQGLRGSPAPKGLSKEEERIWEMDYWTSEAGINELKQSRNYHVEVKPDGNFRVQNVSPGTYDCSIIVEVKTLEGERTVSTEQQRFDRKITVTEENEVMDLGDLTLHK
jgi:hypothetical protein